MHNSGLDRFGDCATFDQPYTFAVLRVSHNQFVNLTTNRSPLVKCCLSATIVWNNRVSHASLILSRHGKRSSALTRSGAITLGSIIAKFKNLCSRENIKQEKVEIIIFAKCKSREIYTLYNIPSMLQATKLKIVLQWLTSSMVLTQMLTSVLVLPGVVTRYLK